jgi:hypothetical protein
MIQLDFPQKLMEIQADKHQQQSIENIHFQSNISSIMPHSNINESFDVKKNFRGSHTDGYQEQSISIVSHLTRGEI